MDNKDKSSSADLSVFRDNGKREPSSGLFRRLRPSFIKSFAGTAVVGASYYLGVEVLGQEPIAWVAHLTAVATHIALAALLRH